jgi:hypothetical protein
MPLSRLSAYFCHEVRHFFYVSKLGTLRADGNKDQAPHTDLNLHLGRKSLLLLYLITLCPLKRLLLLLLLLAINYFVCNLTMSKSISCAVFVPFSLCCRDPRTGEGRQSGVFWTRGSYRLLSRLLKGGISGSSDIYHPAHAIFRVSAQSVVLILLLLLLLSSSSSSSSSELVVLLVVFMNFPVWQRGYIQETAGKPWV